MQQDLISLPTAPALDAGLLMAAIPDGGALAGEERTSSDGAFTLTLPT